MSADIKFAPDFTLQGLDKNGETTIFRLDDLLAEKKPLVLYFYPKDDTPGCVAEASDFRDNMEEIDKIAVVAGISPDTIESHSRFREKYGLAFALLSDPDRKVIRAYSALSQTSVLDKVVWGTVRSTFIISPDKKIAASWREVRVLGHVSEVLSELKKMQQG